MANDFFNRSGAAHNYTRPKTSSSPSKERSNPLDKIPCINLINFDDAEFEGSRYVLTSPKSLEACSRVGFKPVDLLYKGLREFEQENPGMPIRELYRIFETSEQKRKENLQLARDERERLIAADHTPDTRHFPPPRVMGASQRSSSLSRISRTEDTVEYTNGVSMNGTGRPYRPSSASGPRQPSTEAIRASRGRPPIRKETLPLKRSTIGAQNGMIPHHPRASSAPSRRPIAPSTVKTPDLETQLAQSKLGYSERRRLELMVQRQKSMTSEDSRRRDTQTQRDRQRQLELLERDVGANGERRRTALEQTRRELKKLEEKYQREVTMAEDIEEKKKDIRYKEEKHQLLLENERLRIENQLMSRRCAMQEKRVKIAEHLAAQEAENAEFQSTSIMRSEEAHRRAEGERLARENAFKERKRMENKMKTESFMERRSYLDKMKEEEINEHLKELENKKYVVESNLHKLQSEKGRAIESQKNDRDKRMQASAERRQMLEREIEEYKSELQHYRNLSLQRAEERINQKYKTTKQTVQEKRKLKEQIRWQNMANIQNSEEDWKNEWAGILRQKEEKTRRLQEEKYMRATRSRADAHTAEILRDEIRKSYQMDSFDKKARQAELVNKMGLGHNITR